MAWTVRGNLALVVSAAVNATSSGQFSARFCSSGDASCVKFTIHNVTCRESGPVICAVEGDYGSRTAQLDVQGKVINIYQAVFILYMLSIFRDMCSFVAVLWPLASLCMQRPGNTAHCPYLDIVLVF